MVLVGGGFFTGRYDSVENQVEAGSRFDPTKLQGQVGCLFLV
jgi:aflatoxin B1 aldehyde reductase